MSSLCTIIAALAEFAIVLVLKHASVKTVESTKLDAKDEKLSNTNRVNAIGFKMDNPNIQRNEGSAAKEAPKKLMYEKIDYACFRIFPLLFALFNAIYLAKYSLV